MNPKITKCLVLAGACGTCLLAATPVFAENQTGVSGQDIYRLYNSLTGEHLYTSKSTEKAQLIKAG